MINHQRALIALALIIGALVGPVCAMEYSTTMLPDANTTHLYGEDVLSYSHDANTLENKITLIYFTVPTNSQIDFTLYYGNGSTVSGYIENHQTGLGYTTATVSIDSVTKSYNYFDVNQFYDIDVAGYAQQTNDTSIKGILIHSDAYGVFDNDLAAFYPVPSLAQNLIYRVDATGTKPFNIEVVDSPPMDAAQGVSYSVLGTAQSWIDFAFGIGGAVLGVVTGLLFWLKFLFVDNLIMIIALYLTISMAYAACTSRNVFVFFKRFLKSQQAFFMFLLSLWGILVTIVSEFRAIFRI